MSYQFTNPLKSLVGTAAVAISLCAISAPANAEMIRYEFTNTPNTSDLLSGFFYYNHAVDIESFGDVGISVNFGGEIGVMDFSGFLLQKPRFNPHWDPNVSNGDSWELLSINGETLAYLNIVASSLAGFTPAVNGQGLIRWAATAQTDIKDENGITVGFGFVGLNPTGAFDPFTYPLFVDVSNTFESAFAVAAVPEPSTYAMMAIGLLGIAGMRRRQNKA